MKKWNQRGTLYRLARKLKEKISQEKNFIFAIELSLSKPNPILWLYEKTQKLQINEFPFTHFIKDEKSINLNDFCNWIPTLFDTPVLISILQIIVTYTNIYKHKINVHPSLRCTESVQRDLNDQMMKSLKNFARHTNTPRVQINGQIKKAITVVHNQLFWRKILTDYFKINQSVALTRFTTWFNP